MFQLHDFIANKVKLKPNKSKSIIKTITKIEIILNAIEELEKKEIKYLNEQFKSLQLQKERLENEQKNILILENNSVKSINYKTEIEKSKNHCSIFKDSIEKLKLNIASLITRIISEIKNISDELTNIISEISKIKNSSIIKYTLELKELNEIISKTKIKLNYTIENTILELNFICKKLTEISNIFTNVLKYREEIEANNLIYLNNN